MGWCTFNGSTGEIARAAYNEREAFAVGISDSSEAMPKDSSVSNAPTK